MKNLFLTALALVPATAVAVAPAAWSAPGAPVLQDEEEKPDKRPEVAQLIDQLEEHLKARGDEDDEAIAVIDELSVEFEESGPKDRADIASAVGECLTVKRKDLAEDVPDQKLQTHAARVMGAFGEEGGELLLKLVEHKALEGKLKAQREAILSLGRTQHPKGVKVLLKLLDNKVYEVEGAAAQALGSYTDADEKVRKEIVEALLKKIVPLADVMEDEGDYSGSGPSTTEDLEEAQKEYNALAAGTMAALRALTGHTEEDFRAWQAWWNDNKRKKWDEDEG